MNSYVYIKHKRKGDRINEPSFCDRVLWRSYPGTRITNTSYGKWERGLCNKPLWAWPFVVWFWWLKVVCMGTEAGDRVEWFMPCQGVVVYARVVYAKVV